MSNVFDVDNIIVGLFKNMLRKNTTHDNEGFIVHDKHFFSVELDASGFDESIIISSLEELNSNSKWFEVENGDIYSADINQVTFNHEDETISFTIRKSMLIELRESILKSK